MDDEKRQRPVGRLLAVGAVLFGLAAGSYGIAMAATGSGSGAQAPAASTTAVPAATTQPQGPPPGGQQGGPWGHQRSDETLLTGDTAAKVTQAAKDKVSGAIIVRVETDADGNAAYEAHMVTSDGSPVTVYVGKDFNVVSVERR